MSLAPGNATAETLTRDLLSSESALLLDGTEADAIVAERHGRQMRALDLLDALDLEGLTVERETGEGGRTFVVRDAGTIGLIDGVLVRVAVLAKDTRPATVAYGGAYGASARETFITAALMLLAAVDCEERGG